MANLEELANARRLRVTAVIPPQYNPIRPRLRPPLVEPRRFHSSAFTLAPPPSAIATSTRCSFQRSFPPEPLVSPSFRRCTAAYNEWCTPSKALRFCSLFFFHVPLSFSTPPSPLPLPLCPRLRRCPLIFRLLFLLLAFSPSCRALTGLISPFFLLSSISYSAPWE